MDEKLINNWKKFFYRLVHNVDDGIVEDLLWDIDFEHYLSMWDGDSDSGLSEMLQNFWADFNEASYIIFNTNIE